MRPNGELPSDHYADRRRHTPELGREPHLAVQRPAACSGVKALRNTSDAKAASRQALLAFRSLLTPSARSENLIAGDGTKNGLPLRTKNRQQTKNNHLTGKAPYKSDELPTTASRGPKAGWQASRSGTECVRDAGTKMLDVKRDVRIFGQERASWLGVPVRQSPSAIARTNGDPPSSRL